jgi:hypothetical protein
LRRFLREAIFPKSDSRRETRHGGQDHIWDEPSAEKPTDDQAFFLALAAKGKDAWNAWRRDPANKDVSVPTPASTFPKRRRTRSISRGSATMRIFRGAGGGALTNWELPLPLHEAAPVSLAQPSDLGPTLPAQHSVSGPTFTGAAFGILARFTDAVFDRATKFTGAAFGDATKFDDSVFNGWVLFNGESKEKRTAELD